MTSRSVLLNHIFLKFLVSSSLFLSAAPAQAVSSCIDASGKNVFSDLPCFSNNAKETAVPRDVQERRDRERRRSEKIAPPELMQAYDRCSSAAGLNSLEKFIGCLSKDSTNARPRSENEIADLLKRWQKEMPIRPEVLSGLIQKEQGFGHIVVAVYEDLDIDREQKVFVRYKPEVRFILDKDSVWRVIGVR